MTTNREARMEALRTAHSEGRFESEWRKQGRDSEFQVHLAKRHATIVFHKLMRPWAVPLLDRLSRWLNARAS